MPFIYGAMDRVLSGSVCTAFDVVDDDILILCLLVSFGTSGKPLDWLCSFCDGCMSLSSVDLIGLPILLVCCKALFSAHCCTFSTWQTFQLSWHRVMSRSALRWWHPDMLALSSILCSFCCYHWVVMALGAWMSHNRLCLNAIYMAG